MEFVQVSCTPFLPRLTEVARCRFPKSPRTVPNCLEHDWSGSTTQQSVERQQRFRAMTEAARRLSSRSGGHSHPMS